MNVTPAMQQYYDLKAKYLDAILFFRMGDFYEMFEDDAVIAHKVLGINLTSRNKNVENPIPLAGIPYHAKEKYLGKLIDAGYKVAISEQVSDPKLKGIVQREVVRVVTPGTLSLEEDYIGNTDSNTLCSIVGEGDCYGFSVIDLSNHTWICSEFDSLEKLFTEIYKISPKEVILEKLLLGNSSLEEVLSKKYSLNIYYYDADINTSAYLSKKLGVSSLSGLGIQDKNLAQKASAYILHYIEKNQSSNLSFLDALKFESFSGYLELDEATIKSLDIVYNIATSSAAKGTLLGVLNQTKTPMGKRYLREELLHPLQSIDEIQNRQEYIQSFKDNPIILESIRDKLKEIADLDAILSRISLERAGPRDLLLLKNSLVNIKEIIQIIQNSESKKLKKIFKSL